MRGHEMFLLALIARVAKSLAARHGLRRHFQKMARDVEFALIAGVMEYRQKMVAQAPRRAQIAIGPVAAHCDASRISAPEPCAGSRKSRPGFAPASGASHFI